MTDIRISASTKWTSKPVRTFTIAEIEEAAQDQCGFCISCGAINSEVEPDARRYPCEECGAKRVYGTDSIAEMGRIQ